MKAALPVCTEEDLKQQQRHHFTLKTSQDLRDGHLWISIFSKPAHSTFTRAQRLTCALSLLLATMLTSIMFHGVPTDDPGDQFKAGEISFSLSDLVIGIESGLIMFPINIIILQLFLKVAPRPTSKGKSYSDDVVPEISKSCDQDLGVQLISDKKCTDGSDPVVCTNPTDVRLESINVDVEDGENCKGKDVVSMEKSDESKVKEPKPPKRYGKNLVSVGPFG